MTIGIRIEHVTHHDQHIIQVSLIVRNIINNVIIGKNLEIFISVNIMCLNYMNLIKYICHHSYF